MFPVCHRTNSIIRVYVGKDIHEKRSLAMVDEGIKHGHDLGGNDATAAPRRAMVLSRRQDHCRGVQKL